MRPERALPDRGEEIDVLSRLIADAARGSGGIVVLEGPAGIGKTALIRRAGELADGHDPALVRLCATNSRGVRSGPSPRGAGDRPAGPQDRQ